VNSRVPSHAIVAAAFFLGVLTDFIFNGVLKIVWIAIYGSVYLTLSGGIYTYLLTSQWKQYAVKSGIAVLLGSIVSHLLFTGQVEIRHYDMRLTSEAQLVLQAPELSQTLYVASENAVKALGKFEKNVSVPVTVQVVKDYGCILSFKVITVAGVDVMGDAQSSWVWKQVDSRSPPPGGFSGLNEENSRRPWCTIKWF
jgi:hypothetical protein